ASALTRPITVVGNGMKMSRDTNRQIVYGTHDSTTTMQKTITVKTHFYNQLPSSDSTTTAVKYGNHWATENKKIPPIFVLGTLQVSKSMNENFNPNPFYVYYAPTGLTYNNLNTFNITQSTTPYTTNKPIIYTNYDSNNLLYSINPAYTGISIHPTTGIITIYSDTVFKLYGKKIIPTITAQSGLGKTSTAVTLNIINTYIIGYNNTSVCLPNSNGADYIRIPSVDLRNSNFAIETWFKLMGSPTSNKRIFDFAPGTTGNDRSGLILYFPVNKIKLGAFNEDGLIDLGNADTVLKNGLNEWNKYSVFYNATTKTYYVYINGVLKKMATVSTDKYTAPLISNFLANNNYADPVTDGYFREFKIYKNVSYADFIKNLSYNILPNRPDNTLYYYLPLSNNVNNSTYIGNITINNNTALTNKALMYNPNALNNNATLISANNRAFYYGDSINQIITGEFVDQTNRLRFSYTNGVIKDTILPNVAIEKYSWQVRGKNISGKFKVYSSVSTQYADSIQVLLIPYKLNYASNNRGYPIIAGNSGTPTFIGSEPILFSIDSGNATGFSINANTGVISWGNTIASGFYKLRVLASNAVGTSNFTYSVNIQDTLQGFSYTPDSVIVSGYNADSLPFLPNLTKGTGVTFSILNPTTGFSINANNGRLYWTNTVANGVYKIRVRANNVYNLPLTDTVTIILTTQAPYNLKYLQDTMVFSQGVNIQTPKPSINRGGLPTIFTISNITPSGANIRIDSLTGEIKWASNTLGTYTITVVATNSLGFVSKTIQITILSAANIALDYNNASLTLGVLFAGNTNNNRIELPNLDLRGAGYTIETWARSLNAVGVGNWRRIFDFGTGQNYDGVILGFQSATTLGVHASTGEDYIFNFPLNFNALNWNHYAVTVSDSVRLYVNGVLLGTARANKPSVIFNKNYLNFSNWVGDAAGLNAYQECRIWKYARSGADIAQNYQGSVPNDAFGLYYYLPFKQTGYIPGVIINPTNFVLAPEAGLFMGSPYYTSNIANTAVNSILTDSSKIWAVVPNSVVLNTNQVSELIPYYKTDSTRQKIQGYYAGTLAAGEVLQYSIDTGRTWKKIGFVQDNNWIQTIDTGFKFGQIKIRSIINNIVTNRQFNDIDVVVYPNPPINLRATALNDGTVTLQFIPPVVNATITGYKIYSQAGVLVGTATQSPAIITGLNNGQAYQFNVSSINSKGESPLSTISNSIIVVNNILQISTSTNTIDGVSITPTTNVTAYTNFRVTYQIKTGYKLDSIYINNVRNRDSIFGSVTFLNINSSQRVQVYASKIPFTLTITKNSGGVITSNQVVSPIQSTITTYYGDTLTIQFIPDNRYKVDSVFINGMYNADVKSSYTFTNIQENNTVRV
ncbi:MAG: fibronectin type III domain-containing protein, partial [Sediminibacterium sp.]|nr:fibronectin type III domain-containing protein [Sediminibacterium sp.]